MPWLTDESVMPAGTTYETTVPDTLDLAEAAREAVHGLTAFLDDRMHHSGFGHGIFATQPPCLIHDQGQDQNWGKVLEALALARAMSGSREHLDRQRASMEAMLSYAELKSVEPYPVPLARILMAADALNRYCPHPELPRLIARIGLFGEGCTTGDMTYLVVRIPRWADKRRVECAVGSKPLRFSWLGNYLMMPEVKRGQSVVIRFPMNETTETVDLACRLDLFWLESTQPPASWRGARPTRFTLTFRGNTLADIHPRDPRAGYPLYATRSLESLRRPAAIKTVRRFVPAQP